MLFRLDFGFPKGLVFALWQDAGFLHHLQHGGCSVVVLSGSWGDGILHWSRQRVDPLRDPSGAHWEQFLHSPVLDS